MTRAMLTVLVVTLTAIAWMPLASADTATSPVTIEATYLGDLSRSHVIAAATPASEPVRFTVRCDGEPCDPTYIRWRHNTELVGSDPALSLHVPTPGQHTIAVITTSGRATFQLHVATGTRDLPATTDRPDRQALWTALATGLLPPCGASTSNELRHCPEPDPADIAGQIPATTPTGDPYTYGDCASGWAATPRHRDLQEGSEDGCFTRAQLAATRAALTGQPAGDPAICPDSTDPQLAALASSNLLDISEGCQPQRTVTQGELYAVLAPQPNGSTTGLLDAGAPVAADPSCSDTTCFEPDVALTRAQAATLLHWLSLPPSQRVPVTVRLDAAVSTDPDTVTLTATIDTAGVRQRPVDLRWGRLAGDCPAVTVDPAPQATETCTFPLPSGVPGSAGVTVTIDGHLPVVRTVQLSTDGQPPSTPTVHAQPPERDGTAYVALSSQSERTPGWQVADHPDGPWHTTLRRPNFFAGVGGDRNGLLVVRPAPNGGGTPMLHVRACSPAGCSDTATVTATVSDPDGRADVRIPISTYVADESGAFPLPGSRPLTLLPPTTGLSVPSGAADGGFPLDEGGTVTSATLRADDAADLPLLVRYRDADQLAFQVCVTGIGIFSLQDPCHLAGALQTVQGR